MTERFAGRVAVITGAGRGIGQATADAFRREGARVVYLDSNEAAATAAAGRAVEGGEGLGLACDVSKAADVAAAIAATRDRFGGIDIVVNNAGICTLNLAVDLSEEEWDRVMAVNVKGMWLMCKYALPVMGEGGAIVNIASQAARRAQRFTAHYSASKMAVIGFTRALAVEAAPRVRVNAVSPGTIGTDMIQHEVNWRVSRNFDPTPESVERGWLDRIPMGRYQKPEHVARTILFLASDDASETTGECVNVSGGAVME